VTPDLSGSFDLRLGSNYAPVVWHEPVLDEYWNKLEANIFLRASKIKRMYIENVEMTKECMAALVKIFCSGRANNSSSFVEFDNANLCADGIISLSEYVDVSSELKTFCLYHNRIDNMESARCLSRSLKSHTGINLLYLTHCDLGSNPEILLVILQSDVRSINLSNNNIDSLGAVKIAEYLGDDPPIESLFLGHNRLNDDDAILISQALKRNTMLMLLQINTNNLTSVGLKALLTCAFDSSSLNAISQSNHSLKNLFILSGQESDNLAGSIDGMLQLGQTGKIMLALQDRDSLLQYLAKVPVGLMPDVLAFPLGHVHDERQHRFYLNIVYSTMRWWNMPMLYSYHCCVKSDTKRKRTD
jgi:Ran GTPase-activating protein (RanGAP) involved in mRNA processing and transport